MSKCTVSLSHTMHILLALECATLIVISIHNLCSELICHSLTTTLASEDNKILHRDTLLAIRTNFCRNLEGCTTNTAALNLNLWSNIVESLLPNLKCRLLLVSHLSLYGIECIVENLIRCILLTIIHQMIYEFRDLLVIEDWIWEDHSLLWFCFSHFLIEKI